MPDLSDGESTVVAGSGSSKYTLKNTGGVYSCTCPAWMHQSLAIERRTCKHLRAYRGAAEEDARVGTAQASTPSANRPSPEVSGDPSKEPPLLLAHRWEGDSDLTGWWMSEKLDGVRAYWDGQKFLSRLGNKFFVPAWFCQGLPPTPLDGELWGGRKQFQRTVGIVKRQDETPLWKDLLYVVFDAPSQGGTFEERLAHCAEVVGGGRLEHVRVHEHVRCQGNDHLRAELAKVEALGGEGLMVRKPGSRYEAGRSSTLLKVKNFYDAEAIVIGHVAGAGRHKGRLGALVVELEDGTQFNVGTGFSDNEREHAPAVGTVITFRYQELSTGGVPRFPSYVGVRQDVAWKGNKVPPAPATTPARPARTALGADTVDDSRSDDRGGWRRFEMQDGDTRYFWEIRAEGAKHRVRYGSFEARVKTFDSPEAAAKALEDRIADKVGKGFAEVDND